MEISGHLSLYHKPLMSWRNWWVSQSICSAWKERSKKHCDMMASQLVRQFVQAAIYFWWFLIMYGERVGYIHIGFCEFCPMKNWITACWFNIKSDIEWESTTKRPTEHTSKREWRSSCLRLFFIGRMNELVADCGKSSVSEIQMIWKWGHFGS